ncbi:MAG TPA: [acyl-carrier-protein] S-malonyltransferase [Chloroflexi bacterium]|nr:[acyl-carrier-protein] S-malonyltransferase [Chloroflexota bacterium]
MSQHFLALQFPGQGSQQVGMGKDLCALSPVAAAIFAQADEVLGFPLSRLCFEGPPEPLNDTANTQPAILTVSVAALRALEERLGQPAFVAGHSLGEFSALVAAGALAFEEALVLVRERGRLMKEAGEHNPGGMAAVIGLEAAEVEDTCAGVREVTGGYVGVANDNCPGQVVISGDEETLQAGIEAMKAAGARRVIRLAVSIAAHSPLMAEAAAAFRRALEKAAIRPPKVPFVANSTASPVTDPDQIREVLGRQLTSPIHWAGSVQWMIRRGATQFVEIGPGEVLTRLLRRIDSTVERLTTAQVLAHTASTV